MNSKPLGWAPLLLVTLALGLGGCSKKPEDRLQGTWVGQALETKTAIHRDDANAWVREASFRFVGETLAVTILEGTKTGTFKVARADGDQLDLDIRDRDQTSYPTRLELVENRELRWTLDPQTIVVMRRAEDTFRN